MNFLIEFKYILRSLFNDKSFTILSISVVALGISILTCVYVLTYEIYEKPLSYEDGNKIVIVKSFDTETKRSGTRQTFNGFVYNELKDNISDLVELGAVRGTQVLLTDGETTSLALGSFTSPNLISMTGVRPLLGRTLLESDANNGANPVVMISESLWLNHYAGDKDIIGKQSRINGQLRTIIGVMPKTFRFPETQQNIWFPLHVPRIVDVEDTTNYTIVGKLSKAGNKRKATQNINRILATIATNYQPSYKHLLSSVQSYRRIGSTRASEIQPAVAALPIVLFALACINLSALLFVRHLNRVKELGVRFCLGASHWQLTRRILLESGILCCLGSLLSLSLSQGVLFLVTVLREAAPDAMATLQLGLSIQTLMPIMFMTLFIWLAPSAMSTFRLLRQARKSTSNFLTAKNSDINRNLTMRLVIGSQTLLSCFLLTLCGLLSISIYRVYQTDFGINGEDISVAQFSFFTPNYQDSVSRLSFVDNLSRRLLQEPAISEVAFTATLPSRKPREVGFTVRDRELKTNGEYPSVGSIAVSENYFQLLGVDLIEGRGFDSGDNEQSQQVVIVDERLANNLWPNESAIGKQIIVQPEGNAEIYSVVGVNSHIVQASPVRGQELDPTIYFPLQQQAPASLSMVVKSSLSDLTLLSKTIKLAFAEIDRQIPVYQFYSMQDFRKIVIDDWGIIALLFLLVSICALILSVIGIYGLISRSVVSKTLEIGLRRAIGSSVKKIVSLFLGQGFRYLITSLVGATCLTLMASNYLTQIFPAIFNALPWVLAFVCTILGSLILLACYLPAKRALRLEPGDALRYE